MQRIRLFCCVMVFRSKWHILSQEAIDITHHTGELWLLAVEQQQTALLSTTHKQAVEKHNTITRYNNNNCAQTNQKCYTKRRHISAFQHVFRSHHGRESDTKDHAA